MAPDLQRSTTWREGGPGAPPARTSEFSAVLLAPAFDHDLLVGIELDGIAALPVQVAKEAVLPAAEGEIGHGRRHANVNADIPGRRFIAEAPRRGPAGSKQRSLVSVGAALQKSQGFVQVARMNQAENGPENFRVREFAVCGQAVEDGGLHKVSRLIAGN